MKITKEIYIASVFALLTVLLWIVSVFIESLFPVVLVFASVFFGYVTYKLKINYDNKKNILENKAKALLMDVALEDEAEEYLKEKSKFRKIQKAEIKQSLSVNFYLTILSGFTSIYFAWFFVQIIIL